MGKILLCANEETLCHSELLGLRGVCFEKLTWLDTFVSGVLLRRSLSSGSLPDEIWISGCEDLDPLNLAAAVKEDYPSIAVYLIDFVASPTKLSCAKAAGVDKVLNRRLFLERFTLVKNATDSTVFSSTANRQPSPRYSVESSTPQVAFGQGAIVQKSVPTRVEEPLHSASILTFVSGSGGAGKSSVSLVAAHLAQARGLKTLLIDCDLQFGDLDSLSGISDGPRIDQLLERPLELINSLHETTRHPALMFAPKHIEQSELLAKRLPDLLDQLSTRFDCIVLNTGASWAEYHVTLIERSTKSIFLVDQRASSLRACRKALDLCVRCGVATNSFVYVLNRCSKTAPLTAIDVACALRGVRVIELSDGSREVEELLGAGLVLELLESRNEFCLSVNRMLDELLFNPLEGNPYFGDQAMGFAMPVESAGPFKSSGRRSKKRSRRMNAYSQRDR